jgi:hypothetical protein
MRKALILIITVISLASLTAITGVYAFEEKAKIITLSKKEIDITGDGLNDKIYLKGLPYQGKTELKKIYMKITGSDNKTYMIPLGSGNQPKMKVVDLNQDSVKDLFVNIKTEGNRGVCTSYIFTLKDFELTELSTPEPLEIVSRFEDGYKAKIRVAETNSTYLFNLKKRKKYYENLGLFYKGKLNEPTELTVHPFRGLKTFPNQGKEIGLKGIQRISGAVDSDTIAYVESSWLYKNGKWKLEKVVVFKDTNPKK